MDRSSVAKLSNLVGFYHEKNWEWTAGIFAQLVPDLPIIWILHVFFWNFKNIMFSLRFSGTLVDVIHIIERA